jgi:hypothetical protein
MVELDAFNALSPPVRSPDDGSGWHPAHRLGRRGKAADGRRNLPAALLVAQLGDIRRDPPRLGGMYAGRGPNYRCVSTEQHRPTQRGHKRLI